MSQEILIYLRHPTLTFHLMNTREQSQPKIPKICPEDINNFRNELDFRLQPMIWEFPINQNLFP